MANNDASTRDAQKSRDPALTWEVPPVMEASQLQGSTGVGASLPRLDCNVRCSSIATRALLFAQQLEGLLGPGSGADADAAGGAPSGTALLEWRGGFERVAQEHLGALVQQLLTAEGLDVAAWGPVLTRLATEAAASLSPTAITARGDLDVRHYVRVRR